MIKLICLDIDGTLLNDEKEISPVTKNALLKVQDKGIKLALSTGRADYGVLEYIDELKLNEYGGYIISFNGGIIEKVENGNKEILFEKNIDKNLVREVLQYVKNTELSLYLYGKDILYTTSENSYAFDYSKKSANGKVEIIDNLHDVFFMDTPKILLSGENKTIHKYKDEIDKKFSDRLNHTFSDVFYYELMPKNVNKGAGVKYLINYLGINKDEVLAFGDGENDIEMIKEVGYGIAMENAGENLKKIADYICESNNNDGVGKYIEKYVLKS